MYIYTHAYIHIHIYTDMYTHTYTYIQLLYKGTMSITLADVRAIGQARALGVFVARVPGSRSWGGVPLKQGECAPLEREAARVTPPNPRISACLLRDSGMRSVLRSSNGKTVQHGGLQSPNRCWRQHEVPFKQARSSQGLGQYCLIAL